MTNTALVHHRWSRSEYERMAVAGVFAPEDRLELIDGEIWEITPQSSLHATAVRKAEEALRSVFEEGFDVRVQLPMALGPDSEPEPDVAVVPGSCLRRYSVRLQLLHLLRKGGGNEQHVFS